MVYTITDKVIDVIAASPNEKRQAAMDSKFKRVKTDENEGDYSPHEKWRIWRNVLALGFAFMIQFTAFWGASNLQSSVNAEASLGTFTLAAIYASLILSNIFLPVVVIKWFGCKWTVAVSLLTYIPFIASQFYPRFYTMIPAGLAVGLGGGPLWCAKCTYLTVASEAYAQITGVSAEVMVVRFFGVFFMFYQFSQVWGNLISSAILSSGATNITEIVSNATKSDAENYCGANFQPGTVHEEVNPNLTPPEPYKLQMITGIYIGCMVAAFLVVVFFVDSLSRYNKGRTSSSSGVSGLRLLVVTLKQLANPNQILILPITMLIGAEQAFIAADFNAAFVSCGWGISNIGFVMICFGVCNAIAALWTGSISKITGRNPVIAFALALHVSLLVALLVWKPSLENKYIYFVVAGLWGVCDAIWLVQINSLCGLLFPGKEEAAYSNFRLWEATGSVITYIYSPYLDARTKICLLLGLLLVGVCGYTAIEVFEYKNKKAKIDITALKNLKE